LILLLNKRIDNIGLVLFRIVFGLLIAIEGFGAIATGWVRDTLVTPDFTFHFIGFDFLDYLQGPFVYVLFVLLGIFGICVMLGYRYRPAMVGYALIWSCVYLMQKTSYNNHYYLLMLLCWIMVFLPAHRDLSLDAKRNLSLRSSQMPLWVKLVFILQVGIVYIYASLAKLYPGWWDGTAISIFMENKQHYPIIGEWLQLHSVHIIMAYVGIFFDLLIVPLLLWKKTRVFAFVVSILFHLSNSIIFQIGIFPYMSIAFALFFFSPGTLRKIFVPKRKKRFTLNSVETKSNKFLLALFSIYFLFQIGLPLRHLFYPDNVLWTEEGHRLSWRMMLRSRSGYMTMYIRDKKTGERKIYDYHKLLAPKQQSVPAHADLIWQLAQKIKEKEAMEGRDVSVYAKAYISVNRSPYFLFTDSTIDLADQKWNHLSHTSWILPMPGNFLKK